jgi:hypothetical protein
VAYEGNVLSKIILGIIMKLLHDLLFTDYGLMSLIGLVFMLGMGVFFSALIFIKRKDTIIKFT